MDPPTVRAEDRSAAAASPMVSPDWVSALNDPPGATETLRAVDVVDDVPSTMLTHTTPFTAPDTAAPSTSRDPASSAPSSHSDDWWFGFRAGHAAAEAAAAEVAAAQVAAATATPSASASPYSILTAAAVTSSSPHKTDGTGPSPTRAPRLKMSDAIAHNCPPTRRPNPKPAGDQAGDLTQPSDNDDSDVVSASSKGSQRPSKTPKGSASFRRCKKLSTMDEAQARVGAAIPQGWQSCGGVVEYVMPRYDGLHRMPL